MARKIIKITHLLPVNHIMETNEHRAVTYREWCDCEVARIGPGAEIVFAKKGDVVWCRVDRKVN